MPTPYKIEVGYSYPSSPNAVKAGRSREGCFTVSLIKRKRDGSQGLPEAVAHFATREEANAYAFVYQREICPVFPLNDAGRD